MKYKRVYHRKIKPLHNLILVVRKFLSKKAKGESFVHWIGRA